MRARGWVLVAGALTVAVAGPEWARGEAAPGRRVLGTVQVWGPVEARHGTGEWRPLGAGALLEQTDVRTAAEGRTVVELAKGDVVALGGSSSLRVTGDRVPRLALEAGRLAVRFQPSSPLVIDTPAASVALPALRRVAVSGLPEALVSLESGRTTVRSFHGEVEATRPGAEPIVVADSQTVTLGQPEAGAPPAPAAAEDTKSEQSMWAALGLSPGMAAVIGSAVAVGGGVGGAAAAGAFSSDSATTADKTPDQGSPFRPVRPVKR